MSIALLSAGCASVSNPFSFNEPPGAVGATSAVNAPRRTVIVLGHFENPAVGGVRWRDIGSGMSEAIARSLRSDARYDVRVDDVFAREVEALVNRAPAQLAEHIGEIRRRAGSVDFVITGRVTDFHHNADLAPETRRRGLFGPRDEAVVALDLRIIDLQTARIASSDHLHGSAAAGSTPVDELYRGIAFGSYLFWQTPLGEATKHTVDAARLRIARVTPRTVTEMRIARITGRREIEVMAGSDHGLERGQTFHVCIRDAATGELRAVEDPVMRLPLTARVTSVNRAAARAILIGEAPASMNPRDAVLTREPPRAPRQIAHEGSAAASSSASSAP